MAAKKELYFFDENSPIAIQRMQQGELALHDHEFHELVIVFSGTDIPGKNYLSCAYFMQLQCFIARSYSNIKSAEGRVIIGIADLMTYMEKKYQSLTTLKELAKTANMSKSTLNRNFLQATGLSPMKYLINIRIMKAGDLLRSGNNNVSETAFAVGFNDSNYFVRQFRKIMGITPGKYREKAVNSIE